MKKNLNNLIVKLSHNLAIHELRLQNKGISNSKLTYNSILYLNIITAYPGKYTASNIADMLRISRPSVTQKINELEKHGYISKKQSEADKRVFYLFSDEKELLYQEEFKVFEQKIEKMLRDKYSKEQVDQFFEMLDFTSDQYIE